MEKLNITASVDKEPTSNIEGVPVFQFAILDPRPIEQAVVANEQIFANAQGGVLGVEVTVPKLAEKCTLGNIDPQHSEGDISRAAIDDATKIPLPEANITMATVRPDLDSVGAMAVIDLRKKGIVLNTESISRIDQISILDRFSREGWKAKILPSKEDLWKGVDKDLVALGSAVADHKLNLVDRVGIISKWIQKGDVPHEFVEKVGKERLLMVEALESGEIKHELFANGKAVFIESVHSAGTQVGYSIAPVVVALNPKFRLHGGEPHKKYTISQYSSGYVDLQKVLEELKTMEAGWGGSPTIIGSPQGESSVVDNDTIKGILERNLIS